MRRESPVGIRFSMFAVVLGSALASIALAQAAPAVPAGKPAHAALEQPLKAAHKLLAEANFDYKGHRAKAAEEVHHALQGLGYQHHHKVVQGKPAPTGAKAIHEAQQKSDAQLREAEQILRGIEKRGGPAHAKVAAHIKTALHEIHTALTIK